MEQRRQLYIATGYAHSPTNGVNSCPVESEAVKIAFAESVLCIGADSHAQRHGRHGLCAMLETPWSLNACIHHWSSEQLAKNGLK